MSDTGRFPDASTLSQAELDMAERLGMLPAVYAGMKGVRNSQDMTDLQRHLAEREKATDNEGRIAELRAEIESLGGTA